MLRSLDSTQDQRNCEGKKWNLVPEIEGLGGVLVNTRRI